MQPQLLTIYGPLALNSFGLLIIIGLIIFSALFLSDPKREKLISVDEYFNALSVAIIVAIIGGRSLFVITNFKSFLHWSEAFEFWKGGFSLLGGLISLIIVLPFYLHKKKIRMLPLLDLAAVYAPLLQGISRIGCFFAGCCYGIPTRAGWGVINPQCEITTPLHPTQLYSAGALVVIFLLMYFVIRQQLYKPGQALCAYIFLMSMERFSIDFWRADRQYFLNSHLSLFSIPQWIALCIAGAAAFVFWHISVKRRES